ncbi:MAG: glycine cleavage system aminomethyltransferase GcvT [Gammaproteobacteria bacterium]|nr:glycine cleavage system aminomethyltransferase GcvT [Gammaproteobacteria bacterium]NNJ96063.1 glycine cleavage system aminomethyltransferase GcvT [Gammaproteobacteria bacterium]
MSNKTVLYDKHIEYGGKIVDFAGWQMPVNYGSQIDEHHQVRQDAGMFDVSHMTVIDLTGEGVKPFLQVLLANDVVRLKQPGKALYSCMLNHDGGVIDDLIVYFMHDDWYRMVVNAATRDKDLAWIDEQSAGYDVEINERSDLAMIAVQGPHAREKAIEALPVDVVEAVSGLERFFGCACGEWFVGRTGYTGEDGFEIMLPDTEAPALWDGLAEAGVKPCGLGARDTLRLEAGMNLYGADMTESTSPLISGLGWTVAWEPEDREFIGRTILQEQRDQGVVSKWVGLILEGKGILRGHQKVVVEGVGEGETTSGTFSPTLKRSIALARVPKETGDKCQVEIRGKLLNAFVVKPVFVRDGKAAS